MNNLKFTLLIPVLIFLQALLAPADLSLSDFSDRLSSGVPDVMIDALGSVVAPVMSKTLKKPGKTFPVLLQPASSFKLFASSQYVCFQHSSLFISHFEISAFARGPPVLS